MIMSYIYIYIHACMHSTSMYKYFVVVVLYSTVTVEYASIYALNLMSRIIDFSLLLFMYTSVYINYADLLNSHCILDTLGAVVYGDNVGGGGRDWSCRNP